MKRENNNNYSHPNLNMICIVVPVFWNKTSSRTHIFHFSNTKLIHLFLLFFFIGSSPKNRILCIEILFLGLATLVQRAATHLSAIFHDIFSTIKKDTTKSLGL